MSNLESALKLATLGVPVFPCQPNKRPRMGVQWRSQATTDEALIRSWWRRWPDSLPAFEPGRVNLLAIDCDRHGQGDGVKAFSDLAQSCGDDPRDWPTVATPSDGRHVFFLQPGDFGNQRGNLPPAIDVRGSGGYVVAEGAELPDGRSYRAADGLNGLIDAIECQSVPDLPDWLISILKNPEQADEPAPAAPPAHVPTRQQSASRERAAFEAALDAECAAVASAGKGNRNNTLNTAAFNVGTAVGAGWGSRSEAEAALTSAAQACGLNPVEARKTIASGINSGIASPRAALADRDGYGGEIMDVSPLLRSRPISSIGGSLVDSETGEVLAEDDDEDGGALAPPVDEDLTHVPGLVGMITDWIVNSARYPNRRIALGAALTLVGTLLGRRISSPTHAGTHLYVIATMPTGAGKQHPIECVERIMSACHLKRHVGPSQFMSLSAVTKHISEAPLSICLQDEFGALLKKIGHPRASGHEQGITMILRSAWGASFGTIRTPAYATSRSIEIMSPALSIFGPTTPRELFEALRGRDFANGFMNRFLVLDGGERSGEVEPTASARDVPQEIVSACLAAYAAGPRRSGNLAAVTDKNLDADPAPVALAWGNGAHDIYRDLSADCRRRMDADEETGEFMARTAEIALRCATILSAGIGKGDQITTAAMAWGARLATQSADKLISDVAAYMLDPLSAPEIERKIISKLRAAPSRSMTLRSLHRAMSRHFRFSDDLKRSLDALARANIVVLEKAHIAGGERVIVRIGK